SGIGKALAHEALRRGAFVAVCARNENKLRELYGDVHPDRLLCKPADVSLEPDCKSFIEAVVEKWGSIDVLINNAGVSMRALFEDTDIAVIKELMDINFFGAVF